MNVPGKGQIHILIERVFVAPRCFEWVTSEHAEREFLAGCNFKMSGMAAPFSKRLPP